MNVCVVGGGIIGLSTALYLKKNDKTLKVTVVTEKLTPQTTADGAAGIWGIYLLKGTPIDQQRRWAKATHDLIESFWISENGGKMGISLISCTRLNHDPKLADIWKDIVYGFRPLEDHELKSYGRLTGQHTHGYQFMTFTCEPVKLLPWFMSEFQALGGKVLIQKVTNLTEIGNKLGADVVINCTGVWASQLTADDMMSPLRGQVMRIKAPWIKDVVLDDLDDGNYIITNQDSVVLGGTHQHNDWNTNANDQDRAFIWNGCKALKKWEIDGGKLIKDWVGLRPGRHSVRLERDKNTEGIDVIHNYGHGGSGITIFWGCAMDVFDILQDIKVERNKSRNMSML